MKPKDIKDDYCKFELTVKNGVGKSKFDGDADVVVQAISMVLAETLLSIGTTEDEFVRFCRMTYKIAKEIAKEKEKAKKEGK